MKISALFGLTLGFVSLACASRPAPAVLTIDPRCAALSDTLSKYVSGDALPLARLFGDAPSLRAPARATSTNPVSVEFVVRGDGSVDPSTILITGPSDSDFERDVAAFVGKSRFVPGQLDGCNVLSRYSLTLPAPTIAR
ncbi:MAG: hypothetical protein ABR585_05755 [Gemmatimonadaceae bacterium]